MSELLRDHVTFRAAADALLGPTDAADDFVRHVRAGAKARADPIRVRPHRWYSGAVSVRVYWQAGRFHTLKFASTEDGRLLASHNVSAGGYLSLLLHDWLATSDRFTDICWRTGDQWKTGDPGHSAPTEMGVD